MQERIHVTEEPPQQEGVPTPPKKATVEKIEPFGEQFEKVYFRLGEMRFIQLRYKGGRRSRISTD